VVAVTVAGLERDRRPVPAGRLRLVDGTGSRRPVAKACGPGRSVLVVVLLAALIVVAVALLQAGAGTGSGTSASAIESSGGAAGLPGPARLASARIYTVKPGDTLWSIVAASGIKGDIRPVVDALVAQQHGRPLQVGERIEVP
jgi:hypothetical protein